MRIVILAAALVLAACSPAAPEKEAEPELPVVTTAPDLEPATPWTCVDGQSFSARFLSDPDRVEMSFADGAEFMLPQTVSASGIRYEGEKNLFHAKGDEALWSREGRAETTCRVAEE